VKKEKEMPPTCDVCMEDYSADINGRLPLVYRCCGHGICAVCAQTVLLNENPAQRKCHLCNTPLITPETNGQAVFVKNYALMRELKETPLAPSLEDQPSVYDLELLTSPLRIHLNPSNDAIDRLEYRGRVVRMTGVLGRRRVANEADPPMPVRANNVGIPDDENNRILGMFLRVRDQHQDPDQRQLVEVNQRQQQADAYYYLMVTMIAIALLHICISILTAQEDTKDRIATLVLSIMCLIGLAATLVIDDILSPIDWHNTILLVYINAIVFVGSRIAYNLFDWANVHPWTLYRWCLYRHDIVATSLSTFGLLLQQTANIAPSADTGDSCFLETKSGVPPDIPCFVDAAYWQFAKETVVAKYIFVVILICVFIIVLHHFVVQIVRLRHRR